MGRLTAHDRQRFERDGFLVVPDVVDEAVLRGAEVEIERLMVEVAPGEGDRGPGQSAWFVSRQQLPTCDAMLPKSGAVGIAEELVRPNKLELAFDQIQIAITVPPWSHVPGGPHIDGHGPGQDPPGSFTMLAEVLLTDQRDTESGNLWVWPGSHVKHQQLFHERGTAVLQQTLGHSTLLQPPAALDPPIAVSGSRGDLVLAHYLLGHNKGGNVAAHVRRTVYYRLRVPGHGDRWEQTFLNAWSEYPGLRQGR
jgi:hypothetical protein